MSHPAPTPGEKLKAAAHTKLLVYFKDGNARTLYGRSNASTYVPLDPRELEIKRLKKYAESVHAKINVAILYDVHTGQEVARMKNGQWL
ncbi:hypothetical protein I2I05_18980 [Hymenobacter sp. BT683]|uniref:Uncharacterized protein n=1 Tax=Hymenobacter jeongseonensis TaxID=2791027 RepID=A0ABS0IM96_9BACT|nr:hypothetical protein [Hymenobacter jeongseonensis]MBF9239485.1 hypothetical protein [Hymenobacter jeongseonensis]